MSLLDLDLSDNRQNAAFDNFVNEVVNLNRTLTPDLFAGLQQLWPANDSSLGAPFNTGDSLFDRGEAWFTTSCS